MARDNAPDGMLTSGSEAASLVESAMLLRWRAPELALLLADRAVAAAGDDRVTVLRADHLAVFALNRLERYGPAVHRLLPALRDADTPPELRSELQVELAHCAAGLGEPTTALAAVRPVLAAGDDVAPVLRGTALVVVAECSGALGRGDVVSCALDEADELFREDEHLDRDTALLLRATAKAVNAVCHRRNGAAVEAEAEARAGGELLTGLADPEHDSGQISGWLMLEIVLALLDRGEGEAATREARPLLRHPVRAAGAGVVGWLRLALATRVHMAEGRHEPALALLADAVEVTQRHGIDAVLAECLEGLSQVHEVRGEFADALHCLRSARAAEGRHRRTVEKARSALFEYFGNGRPEAAGLVDQIAVLLSDTGWQRGVPDPDTGLLDAEEYACRVEAALGGSAALSQVLIAVGSAADEPPGLRLLAELSERLRDAVPDGSALGQLMADRIAVLLPATSRAQAQACADRFRTGSAATLGAEISVGVAQHTAGTGADQFLADTVSALHAAADVGEEFAEEPVAVVDLPEEESAAEMVERAEEPTAETVEEPTAEIGGLAEEPATEVVEPAAEVREPAAEVAEPAAEVAEEPAAEQAAPQTVPEPPSAPVVRRRRGANGTPVLVSELLPRSVLSSGRSGRRRAEDRAEGTSATALSANGTSGTAMSGTGSSEIGSSEIATSGTEAASVEGFSSSLPSAGKAERGGTASPDDAAVADPVPPEFPEPGPPLAPTPRVLEWGSNGSPGSDSLHAGMGDLLAQALAAFQEGRPALIDGSEVTEPVGNSIDPIHQRGLVGRRVYGIQLTRDPAYRDFGNVAEALTDPELRLPDLTAEPSWRPDGTGHQSAAGE
ncbi:MAG: hypothetical protein ACRDTC_17075 [Pseudonocardiaceae bacterium]